MATKCHIFRLLYPRKFIYTLVVAKNSNAFTFIPPNCIGTLFTANVSNRLIVSSVPVFFTSFIEKKSTEQITCGHETRSQAERGWVATEKRKH